MREQHEQSGIRILLRSRGPRLLTIGRKQLQLANQKLPAQLLSDKLWKLRN